MLIDHLWATVVSGQQWMTCVGRLAFPLFSFMIVEGYHHTHNLRRYILRLFIFAILSEIPFDLMCNNVIFYPYHQNVLWTFLISICCIFIIENIKEKVAKWQLLFIAVIISLIGVILGFLFMTDYYGFGVLTVLVFYFFRRKKWYYCIGQLVGLYYINAVMLGGRQYPVSIFGLNIEIPEQSFALLALIPIWLYNDEQGLYNKFIKCIWYIFYPAHIFVIAMITTHFINI